MESAPASRFPGCIVTDRLHRPLHGIPGNPVDVLQRLLIVPERVPCDFVLHIGVTDLIKPLCPLLKFGTDLLSAGWHPGIIPYDGKVLRGIVGGRLELPCCKRSAGGLPVRSPDSSLAPRALPSPLLRCTCRGAKAVPDISRSASEFLRQLRDSSRASSTPRMCVGTEPPAAWFGS